MDNYFIFLILGLLVCAGLFFVRLKRTQTRLKKQIRAYQKELSDFVLLECEHSRQNRLGEIASLIIHDLSSPLHAIDFCIQSLVENPEHPKKSEYHRQLQVNMERALQLLRSLKIYLKNPDHKTEGCSIEDIKPHLMTLLSSQKVLFDVHPQIEFEPAVTAIKFSLSQGDLIHVLLNLIENSIQNKTLSVESVPQIKIGLHKKNSHFAVIRMDDNGKGLSARLFEEMTSLDRPVFSEVRVGLGLRLVRRLVERYGGSLQVNEEKFFDTGTRFLLELPMTKSLAMRSEYEVKRESHLDS